MDGVRKSLVDLARGVLRSVGIRTITKTMHRRRVRVPLAFGKLRSLLFDPEYMKVYGEEDIIDFMLSRITQEDVVFDVGAYLGLHTVLFASVGRTVTAFEPHPRTFRMLQHTIKANRARNVIACPAAIGGEAKTADLWGTGSASSLQASDTSRQKNRVTVVTLDGYAETAGIIPDVMKIDVEGAEHQVLVGAVKCLEHCRLVCLEIHFQELARFHATPEMIYDLLTGRGFKEIWRRDAIRDGRADPSRRHVVFAKSESG